MWNITETMWKFVSKFPLTLSYKTYVWHVSKRHFMHCSKQQQDFKVLTRIPHDPLFIYESKFAIKVCNMTRSTTLTHCKAEGAHSFISVWHLRNSLHNYVFKCSWNNLLFQNVSSYRNQKQFLYLETMSHIVQFPCSMPDFFQSAMAIIMRAT